jgi:hypothetical protein
VNTETMRAIFWLKRFASVRERLSNRNARELQWLVVEQGMGPQGLYPEMTTATLERTVDWQAVENALKG